MIDATTPAFPNNVIAILADRLGTIDPQDTTILKRPLRHTDPNQSIGLFGALWTPEQDTLEMGHFPAGEPTLGVYQLGIQFFIKDGDEERGLAAHSVFTTLGRRVLYRDQQLRVQLAALSVTDGTTTEAARCAPAAGCRPSRYRAPRPIGPGAGTVLKPRGRVEQLSIVTDAARIQRWIEAVWLAFFVDSALIGRSLQRSPGTGPCVSGREITPAGRDRLNAEPAEIAETLWIFRR